MDVLLVIQRIQEMVFFAVVAANAGKTVFEVSAIKKLMHHLCDNGSQKACRH